MCYAPRYTEVGELGTRILWAIVRVKDFGDAMLCKHLFSAARQPCWHCSGWVEDIKQRSSLSINCQLPGSQLLLA